MENLRNLIDQSKRFDWDKGNVEKNITKHTVTPYECEETFFNEPFVEEIPTIETRKEQRYYAFGITNQWRKLTIVFTLRNEKIRIISARDMSRKEKRNYGKRIEKGAQV